MSCDKGQMRYTSLFHRDDAVDVPSDTIIELNIESMMSGKQVVSSGKNRIAKVHRVRMGLTHQFADTSAGKGAVVDASACICRNDPVLASNIDFQQKYLNGQAIPVLPRTRLRPATLFTGATVYLGGSTDMFDIYLNDDIILSRALFCIRLDIDSLVVSSPVVSVSAGIVIDYKTYDIPAREYEKMVLNYARMPQTIERRNFPGN